MKKILLYIVAVVTVSVNWHCKKSLIDPSNPNAYTLDSYFKNDNEMNQAVVATYGTFLHQGLWARDYYFIFDLLGYEAKNDAPMQGDLLQLAQYNFGNNQPQLSQLWASLYRMIFRSNVVIDRAEVWQPTVPAEQQRKKQYVAEARFLKSYANLHLAFLYGDAPLRTSYDSTLANRYPSRTPVSEIWRTVEADLTLAIPDLPVSYPAAGLGRATQGAAIALLGKAYLYQKKWAAAQTEFTKLTKAPFTYILSPNYLDVFSTTNQSNPENIFQVMNGVWDQAAGDAYFAYGGVEAFGRRATHSARAQEYGFNDFKNVFITTSAVRAFTYPSPVDGTTYRDPRARFTFYGDAASGGQTVFCQQCTTGPVNFPFAGANGGYRWLKYEYYNQRASFGGPQSTINGQVIRYADVLLMLAETYIQQGNTGSQPLALIDSVRSRSGAALYTSLGSIANAMQILMRERQLELAGEQSRYFDLIRWGIAKETINTLRQAEDGTQPFQDKNLLFPIPLGERNANPNVNAQVRDEWN